MWQIALPRIWIRYGKMTATVSLVTPSYNRDFESCRLLCDSIDLFAAGYEKHYIVVADDDFALFSKLTSSKREVVCDSDLLPGALRALPRFLKWKGRQYYWAPGAGLPVYGWHVQQLRKFSVTLWQPCPRVICIDSDNCLVRPFHAGTAAGQERSPLYADPGGINDNRPDHVKWQRNAYRLLGAKEPALPGDDYIGQMIIWDRDSVSLILEKVEAVTGLPWWKALCRARNFSEYILYGLGVNISHELATRHRHVTKSLCETYWSGPALGTAGIKALIEGLDTDKFAIAIQSHTMTAPSLIRDAVLPPNP